MKKGIISFFTGLMIIFNLTACFPNQAFGLTLFFDDFESDLSLWYGKGGGAHHGFISTNPLEPDNALTFSSDAF